MFGLDAMKLIVVLCKLLRIINNKTNLTSEVKTGNRLFAVTFTPSHIKEYITESGAKCLTAQQKPFDL